MRKLIFLVLLGTLIVASAGGVSGCGGGNPTGSSTPPSPFTDPAAYEGTYSLTSTDCQGTSFKTPINVFDTGIEFGGFVVFTAEANDGSLFGIGVKADGSSLICPVTLPNLFNGACAGSCVGKADGESFTGVCDVGGSVCNVEYSK